MCEVWSRKKSAMWWPNGGFENLNSRQVIISMDGPLDHACDHRSLVMCGLSRGNWSAMTTSNQYQSEIDQTGQSIKSDPESTSTIGSAELIPPSGNSWTAIPS